jgi:hypothetical protein
MPGFHSAMSPSKIEQYSICSASFKASQGRLDASKPDAIQGTAAHWVHEQCLKNGENASLHWLEPVLVEEADGLVHEVRVDDEMVVNVQESVDRCNEVQATHVFVEVRVNISKYTPIPDQSGSSDFFAYNAPTRTLTVIDFKYGKGVRVHARRRPQLVYYALGVLEDMREFDVDRVVICVHQPRLENWDEWETTPEELRELGEYHKRRLALCLEPNPAYHPDEKACKFCKIRTECRARAEQVRKIANGYFEDLDADIATFDSTWPDENINAELMTIDELVAVRQHAKAMRSFFRDVDVRLMQMLVEGIEGSGLKLVEGRSFRKYADHATAMSAAAWLMQHGVPSSRVLRVKTISPAQGEKCVPAALRKEFGDRFVIKPAGKPAIASSDDPRPAFRPSTELLFDDLDDDEDE